MAKRSLGNSSPPPSLGKEGWAFSSGHMHATTVFLGYMAWQFRQNKLLMAFIVILLTGIGTALVIKGYHYPMDIAAAIGFAVITIGIAFLVHKKNILQI